MTKDEKWKNYKSGLLLDIQSGNVPPAVKELVERIRAKGRTDEHAVEIISGIMAGSFLSGSKVEFEQMEALFREVPDELL